jgi:hypothetical protein
MADLRPPLDAFERAFGVDGVVTPAGGSAIAMTMLADVKPPAELRIGADPDIAITGPIFTVRRDKVPSLPQGSTILAPRVKGQAATLWKVDQVDDTDPEYFHAVVSV